MVIEFKDRIDNRLVEVNSILRKNDPIIEFIKKDHIGTYKFNTGLRMLPFEIVEKYGTVVLQDEKEFQEHFNPKYDIYQNEWIKHFKGYWKDKLSMLEEYLSPVNSNKTPLVISNDLNKWMIKIERRILLLTPNPVPVEQKHTRISGAQKDYLFLRNNWIDENGEKKRMISKHVGQRYQNIEQEIMDMFHHRGYGVIRNYRSGNGINYDVVLQRGDMKTVVEIKMVNIEIFNKLFMFDALLTKFNEDYPNG